MHIKSMVIDGFKSYGNRTEIDGKRLKIGHRPFET